MRPELAARLAAALWLFWYVHGHVTEARRWLERALDAAPDEPSETRAKVLDGAAYLAHEQGVEEASIAQVEASLSMAKEVGATSTAALAAAHLCALRATVPSGRSDPAPAFAAGEEAIDLARQAGDDFALAVALNNLGVATAVLGGDREQVRAYNEQSLEVRRRIGDTSRIALSLTNLGWGALAEGDTARASALFGEAAEIAPGSATSDTSALRLGGLGWVAYLEERWEEAESFARESLRLARELGMRQEFVDPMFCLAGAAAGKGDTARSARIAAAWELHDSLLGALDADDNARYLAVIERVKAACDPETWEQASAEGRAMSLDEAAEYALSSD